MNQQPLVTVVIPVKNGGERLRECLTAVFAQSTDFPFDVLCVDSGSRDGSVEVVREFGARLIEIPPADFGHGRTRNLAVGATPAAFVAMITQDAVPADEHWLGELIGPLREDERVAGVFGPHLPHPGCIPTEAYLLERHFRNFGSDTTRFEIRPGLEGWQHYEKHRAYYRFFSDNNAALRRSVWTKIPYRDVEFMEDQLWAQDVLEAGFVKVYVPRAAVRHSHNYSPLTLLRRTFDETRYFREYCDPPDAMGAAGWLRHAVRQSRADLRKLREDPALPSLERARWAAPAVARNLAQALGAFMGDRYELIPEPVLRRISQHHSLKGDAKEGSDRPGAFELVAKSWKKSVEAFGVSETFTRATLKLAQTATSGVENGWTWSLIGLRREAERWLSAREQETRWWETTEYQLADGSAPLAFPSSRRSEAPDRVMVNWVIPPIGRGGGGHMTIFRMIQKLEQRGHPQRVYIMDGSNLPRSSVHLRMLVREWFLPIDAPVHHLDGEMEPADVVMATSWQTAYAVRRSACAPTRCYFIQDFEPAFFPAGALSRLAEDTYSFGFQAITAGTWLEHMMTSKYGMNARSFRLGVDPKEYFPELRGPQPRRRVFAYMRPYTARRGFELTALALRRVKQEMPEVEIHIAGYDLASDALPFEFVGHGILDAAHLRALFSSCDVALCPSFTNYSLMPQELAACGCPVVDVDVESTRDAYPPGAVVLAEPNVRGMADAIVSLLRDERRRQDQIRAGLEYARALSWDAAADAVEAALREFSTGSERAAHRATSARSGE